MTRLSGFLLLCLTWILWDGCATSHKSMVGSLEEIAVSDLKDIIADLPATAKSALLAKPYFLRQEYEEFHGDSSLVFQARAVLVFFYLDPSLDLCQVRKYRFKRTSGIWDRYEVKLVHIPPNLTGSPTQ